MICRLPNNILNKVARDLLLSKGSQKSWFGQIENICHQYALPHPLELLDKTPEKEVFKTLVKRNVADYWQQVYRAQVSELSSLQYFKPAFCSLLKPHPLLHTAANPYEVNKMVVQLRLLSGRARLGSLLRHFSPANDGVCELCHSETEDLCHFLLPRCPALRERADLLLGYMGTMVEDSINCKPIFDAWLRIATKMLPSGSSSFWTVLFSPKLY